MLHWNKNLGITPSSAWLGSKIPHAAGYGYFYRTQKLNKIAVSFFGDGSAS